MISVCLAAYNGELYIKEQIESILCQLSDNDELIIGDDGSKDNTLNIVNLINDRRIKLLKNNYCNVVKNIESLISVSKGEYIYLADQDDVWLNNKIIICQKYLKLYDLIIHNYFRVDKHKNKLNGESELSTLKKSKYYNLIKNQYIGCCMAFKSKVKKTILPFPANVAMHDIWIGNVCAFRYEIKFVNEKLILYRKHSDTFSERILEKPNSMLKKISMRTKILYEIKLRK